jgi:hypothetical protein
LSRDFTICTLNLFLERKGISFFHEVLKDSKKSSECAENSSHWSYFLLKNHVYFSFLREKWREEKRVVLGEPVLKPLM